mmetsp:Transcript_18400/g.36643  ORF Transcript_18400/g.36643 Transcript_18400/m.36643 type:complete len:238 (+) Transcript_18400:127-840(+)
MRPSICTSMCSARTASANRSSVTGRNTSFLDGTSASSSTSSSGASSSSLRKRWFLVATWWSMPFFMKRMRLLAKAEVFSISWIACLPPPMLRNMRMYTPPMIISPFMDWKTKSLDSSRTSAKLSGPRFSAATTNSMSSLRISMFQIRQGVRMLALRLRSSSCGRLLRSIFARGRVSSLIRSSYRLGCLGVASCPFMSPHSIPSARAASCACRLAAVWLVARRAPSSSTTGTPSRDAS